MDHAKRNTYRNYSKKGLTIRQSKDPKDAKILIDFLNRITESRHFSTHSDEYIANQLKYDFATLYIAEYENQPIAASLCYDSEDTRYYAHSAANDDFRKQRPTDAILTQMIIDAKRKGKKYFDFWGATTSNDPKDPWYGFTKYKLSFGGQITSYAGTYDIVLKNAKYALYKTLRKANRLKRKILR
jgi:lipid II:glycine glycyltransferase (peptidoglycan interpeptide bridge formation enzyme)